MSRAGLLLLGLGVLNGGAAAQESRGEAIAPRAEVRFNRDIRPILAETCFPCHGPDPASRKAALRFDREEDFFERRESGFVVVKGAPQQSLLYQRITSADEDERMPPPDAHVQLKPEQQELLRRWIEQGAPWEKHWAFLAPERSAAPKVERAGWARNPLDAFVLAEMEAAGLQPAPEAERSTLARRLSLDLIGLPPSPEQVEAFVHDAREDAYERLVDQLLASPHYGEHRARTWLDAARYADTHGMHFDNYREMWPYRDWVIDAFQRNQRFDAFTIEQLAGDLLPEPTQEQRIATGFHRCGMTTNEGGTIEEENLVGYARERVETTSWVWLGLTANCAVCHDHKFDPLPQRDFYAMSAYFRNTTQPGMDGNVKDSPPVLRLPRAEDRQRAAELPAQIAAARSERDQLVADERARFEAWLEKATVESWEQELAQDAVPAQRLSLVGSTAASRPEDRAGVDPIAATAAPSATWDASGPYGPAARAVDWLALSAPATLAAFELDQPFSISAWVKVAKGAPEGAIFGRMDEAEGSRGWNLWLQGEELAVHLIHRWPDDALKIRTKGGAVQRDTWQHVCITCDGSRQAAGLRLYVDGRSSDVDVERDALRGTIRAQAPFGLARAGVVSPAIAKLIANAAGGPAGYTKCADENDRFELPGTIDVAYGANGKFKYLAQQSGTLRFDNGTFGDPAPGVRKAGYLKSGAVDLDLASRVSLQEVRFYAQALPADAIARQAVAPTLRALLATAPEPRDAASVERLFAVLQGSSATVVAAAARVQALEQEQKALEARSIATHIQEEKSEKALAYVLIRGEYSKRGEAVEPGVFRALHPQAPDAPPNRLGLARWLIASENPLTPRVIVNRLWQELFGTGIVRSSEDFGIMGEAPSHPELLDWLAVEFRSDWDYQRMLKLIVTSATYRQSAVGTAEQRERDPANRLLSHGPRFRMDAEVLRDYALSVSGLLVPTVGGASVKPYQPEGVWEAVGMRESNTKLYRPDRGPALYRRSMYSFWKRMAPPAAMEILNAPNRETSCLRRERTNTPLQALVTLNDPQFVEAARVLAEQVLQRPPEQQVTEAGRRILLRPFTADELPLVRESHERLLAHYAAHADDARALLSVGEHRSDPSLPPVELAAMTLLCNELLNLDEVLNK
ncbi:MAG: DUF1553 domain-containing protein [Planctomycetes bacterium]|nr:DUF1553 domain-containing protein [Planctomycetota bacterium]